VKCQNCINNANNSNVDKNTIERLRKEVCSKNKIIMEHKTQISELLAEEENYKKTINNLKNEISSKERQIKDYKTKYEKLLNEKRNNSAVSTYNRQNGNANNNNYNSSNNQEKNIVLHNYEIIKETHIKEISRFKELNPKDAQIITINTDTGNKSVYRNYSNYKKNVNDNNDYQKIINDLKKENMQLNLKVKDYEKLKAENNLYKKGGNISYKETNNSSLKYANDKLMQENKQLKEKIAQLQKRRY
jgi:hypothetical protein